jgi:hypothetical protein
MAWQEVIPSLFLQVWPGPYKELGPPCKTLGEALPSVGPCTEFSVQCLDGEGEPLGPVHRFPVSVSFQEVWQALSDFRIPPRRVWGEYAGGDIQTSDDEPPSEGTDEEEGDSNV